MNGLIKLGLAAALVAGSAGVAIGQDAASPATPDAGAAAGAAVDPTTTASVGTDFASLQSALDSTATVDLAGLTDASTVNFVTVSSLTGYDPAALDTAISDKSDQMASLKTSIDANAALMAKLEAAGYTSDDVLAVESGADGAFTVYIDDRA